MIPSIIEHDAVSNHTFVAQRLLRELGFASEIYAAIIGPGCAGRVHPLNELPFHADGSQWILYQCSIGAPTADVVARHPGPEAPRLPQHHPGSARRDAGFRRSVKNPVSVAGNCRCSHPSFRTRSPARSTTRRNSTANGFAARPFVPVLVEGGNLDSCRGSRLA